MPARVYTVRGWLELNSRMGGAELQSGTLFNPMMGTLTLRCLFNKRVSVLVVSGDRMSGRQRNTRHAANEGQLSQNSSN